VAVAVALVLPDTALGDVVRLAIAALCGLGFAWAVLHQFQPRRAPEPAPEAA
jgi:hypothetical protein